ncbi:MAG: serine/threonine protein kinase [Acidobacteria bacterium]|nr:MAG: serine/threonine protein kinase [Acidobacteriota bacterium]
MALTAGTRLGPYEILSPIGKGGMGEVFKAKDTRLDRTVAIKVLLEHLADSPERKARFEREAKAISQLNHPHICTLYDVGEQDGVDYLVMEYIEGDTLAQRLKKGPLPLDKALEYGIQIADGLEAAHRAGIVHRDLKPGNAMLTKSGIKLLDFGLAKILAGEAEAGTSDAPTQQRDLTQEQSIIGTLQYMAPEQLEHKPADVRTDIFALGVVLSYHESRHSERRHTDVYYPRTELACRARTPRSHQKLTESWTRAGCCSPQNEISFERDSYRRLHLSHRQRLARRRCRLARASNSLAVCTGRS